MRDNMTLNPSLQSNRDFGSDFDDLEEQQRRRKERIQRKKQERNQKGYIEPEEDIDPDILLEEPKRKKRRKQKKQEPVLWSDDRFDEDELELEDDLDAWHQKRNRKRDNRFE